MTAFDDLLMIQELDTTLDQLRHRHATLPELAALEQLRTAAADAAAQREQVAERLHSLRSAKKEAEDHASLLEDKATRGQHHGARRVRLGAKGARGAHRAHRAFGVRQAECEDVRSS